MLKVPINRLYDVRLVHSHRFLDSQVSGINMNVGIRIFSIVGDLGFAHSRYHSC